MPDSAWRPPWLPGGFLLRPTVADAQETDEVSLENHTDCSFFGAEREKYTKELRDRYWRSRLTNEVTSLRGGKYSSTSTAKRKAEGERGFIDAAIFAKLEEAGVAPAPMTTDDEFLRRVSLDLVGRVPSYEKLSSFRAKGDATKREALVDELLASSEWVDKWTMYFGDMYRNTTRTDVTPRYVPGRNAFFNWLKTSISENRPYDAIVRDLIGGQGSNNFVNEEGFINFLIGSDTNGGPIQDDYDQMAADVAKTFLGMSHVNCVLCHDGRGHLDQLSLWGRSAKRSSAWQFASYFSRSRFVPTRPDPANNNLRYYAIRDDRPTDYTLNTTTGNRPTREPVDGLGLTVAPKYMFGEEQPSSGENYRQAAARAVTGDFQFARATVNYIWAALMGRGLVEPLDQFDPMRLDPENPPGLNWELQASHPQLLNQLAQEFQNNGYNLKWLMKTIVSSDAYQLSSRYEGEWNPSWEPLFARHLARRLWAEEIADAIVTTSGVGMVYQYPTPSAPLYNDREVARVNWAMQLPETGTLGGNFLYVFSRGNRFDEERTSEGSIQQALALMNDNFVLSRIRSTNNASGQSLLNLRIGESDDSFVRAAFQTILSRDPSEAEFEAAVATLRDTSGNTRLQRGENLLWALYNKVDFIYNY
ncbi:MAG: hypothetical protein OHK0021_03150 [Bryobacter sp.]